MMLNTRAGDRELLGFETGGQEARSFSVFETGGQEIRSFSVLKQEVRRPGASRFWNRRSGGQELLGF
jgi:hypothetical protein